MKTGLSPLCDIEMLIKFVFFLILGFSWSGPVPVEFGPVSVPVLVDLAGTAFFHAGLR